ncbi:hypothetical protein ACFLZY_02810 [Patescibacteria group bacterium]
MWFRRCHHHNFFPLIIAGLTIALILFMVYSFAARQDQKGFDQKQSVVSSVSDKDYRDQIKKVVKDFQKGFAQAETGIEQLVLVEDTLKQVLTIKVPAAYKDMHLELAMTLNLMQSGFRGQQQDLDQGQARLGQLLLQYPWLE